MVNINYNQTVFSFKKGVKNPKIIYYILIGVFLLLGLILLIPIVAILFVGKFDEYADTIYALIGGEIICAIFIVIGSIALIYEKAVVKKAIVKCIKAEDAILRTAYVFEVGSMPITFYRKASKVGVRFTCGNHKKLIISEKYAVLKDYINTECQIVYSPSADDAVILKANGDHKN